MNNYYSVLVQVCISVSPPKTLLSITRIQITGYSRLICAQNKRGLWPKETKKQICPDARVEYAIRGYCKNAGQTEF